MVEMRSGIFTGAREQAPSPVQVCRRDRVQALDPADQREVGAVRLRLSVAVRLSAWSILRRKPGQQLEGTPILFVRSQIRVPSRVKIAVVRTTCEEGCHLVRREPGVPAPNLGNL